MDYIDVNDKLIALLEAHGLACSEHKGWIVTNDNFPLLSMTWYPYPEQGTGTLQVNALINEETCVEECFGSIGEGEDGINDALYNFCTNSLHVLLAALCGINDPEQVGTQEWIINDQKYIAYIGPFGLKTFGESHPGIPEDAFKSIEEVIKSSNITEQYHWFRNYYCNIDNENKIYESLHNNDKWPAGEKSLREVAWIQSDDYYSVRNFIMLVKQP